MTDKPKKLSDTVRALLTAAARRNDHLIAPPKLPVAAARQVGVVDADGNDVPNGQVGEVLLHGPGVMKGYWRNEAETDVVFYPGG
ncbi:MAG: long-chain acyl-CoA synthetase [Solirubrobacterales bacterium]|nr:long-chain acyl-CoA synthetase [Solirubrobacterales bacterium]